MTTAHEDLLYAARAVCSAVTTEGYQALGVSARVALVQLAVYAGRTDVPWWPAWVGREEAQARLRGAAQKERCPVCGCPMGSADCQRSHP